MMTHEFMKQALRAILENSDDMIFLKDENLVYQGASKPFIKLTGNSSESDIVGHTDTEVFEDKNLANRYILDDHRLLARGEDLVDYIEPIPSDDKKARYGSTSKYILRNEDGKVCGILGITRDVTRDYLVRQQYQREFKYLFELPENTYAVCYIDVDSWRVICQRRQKIEKGTLQECCTVDEICSCALESIADKDSEAYHFYKCFRADVLNDIYEQGKKYINFKYERKLSDGSVRWVRNEINFLTDADSGHLCVMLSAKDISAVKDEEKRLEKAAKLDAMTSVFNREATMEHIRRILSEYNDKQHALFMIDIDNFKGLNDTLGHQAGDEFLIGFAQKLKKHFRETDVVGRIGGDEFFVFVRNISETVQVENKAGDILDIVRSVASNYLQVELSGSIGVSRYPENGNTVEELYACSDTALYQAKKSGKNQYVFAK